MVRAGDDAKEVLFDVDFKHGEVPLTAVTLTAEDFALTTMRSSKNPSSGSEGAWPEPNLPPSPRRAFHRIRSTGVGESDPSRIKKFLTTLPYDLRPLR